MFIKFREARMLVKSEVFESVSLVCFGQSEEQSEEWRLLFHSKFNECTSQLVTVKGKLRTFTSVNSAKKALVQLGYSDEPVVTDMRN